MQMEMKKLLENKKKELEEIQRFGSKKLMSWLKNGFAQVPNEVISDPNLPHLTFRIYAAILMHTFDGISCNPSQETIAREIGLKGENKRVTVNKHIRALKKKNYIKVEGVNGARCTYFPLKKVPIKRARGP